jgi:hypothetical protein
VLVFGPRSAVGSTMLAIAFTVDETCCRSGGRRFQRDSFGSSKARADDDLKV